MTTPSIIPSTFPTSNPFLQAPQLWDGGAQLVRTQVIIPSGTLSGTIVGLVPFRKGFKLSYPGTNLYTPDLDTGAGVTFDVGYVYDDAVTYTSDPNAFVVTSTTPQGGGFITFTDLAGITFVAAADGWIAITTGGGTTTTTGTLTFQTTITYGTVAQEV